MTGRRRVGGSGGPGGRRAARIALRLAAAAAIAAMSAAIPARADDGVTDEADGMLRTARWEAGAFGRSVAGRACWIDGRDGAWRIEVLLEPADGCDGSDGCLSRLLSRTGEGWTLAAAGSGAATYGAWGEEWRPLRSGLALRVAQIVALLDAGSDGIRDARLPRVAMLPERRPASGRIRWWRRGEAAAGNPAARLSLPPDGEDAAGPEGRPEDVSWRRASVERGRGRGGPGEIWSVEWHASEEAGGPAMTLRSSRRPGRLRVDGIVARPVRYPVPETFLPLWPLERLLEAQP